MDRTRFNAILPKLIFSELQCGTEQFREGAKSVFGVDTAQEAKCAVHALTGEAPPQAKKKRGRPKKVAKVENSEIIEID